VRGESVVPAFDVCGPLPTGVTVLEASAGTGKTFTIAALAARYVAEGVVTLDDLLLVTFTRMATGELRQRVRERLVSAEAGLTTVVDGGAPDPADEVLVLLADGAGDEVRARRDRLRVALSDFDAATIETTHGFCSRVLAGVGVAGDVDRDATFADDPRHLVEEVVTDFYLRKYVDGGDPAFTLEEARRLARQVVANPDAALHPAEPKGEPAATRRRFAENVRAELDRRRRRAGALTFDDLLTRVRNTLADPVQGPAACRRLRERYRVALVDEFQDTDPIQWEILRRAFVDDAAAATLVLIGDPKQAIYAFRGADVHAYLDAAAVAGERATLQVSWRSDQPLLDGLDALFDGARLGHDQIVHRPVRAADGHQESRLTGAPVAAPLRIRLLHREDGLVKLASGRVDLEEARAYVAGDLAADVARLLSAGAEVPRPPDEGAGPDTVALRPRHVGVLVQRHRDATTVQQALARAGIPAVVSGAGSVLATDAARDWLRLLEALERPTAANPVRAATLTCFLGWSAAQVATATEAEWEDLHARVHRWAAVLRRRGVAALLETVSRQEALERRVLTRTRGERVLTDVRHVGQLLHEAATDEQLGVSSLVTWLRDAIDRSEEDAGAEERNRLLESDAEAVQVLTVHRSKGLEFPVVYCPYLWHPGWIDPHELPVFHDPDAGGRRTVALTGDDPQVAGLHRRERRGEELRLAYVALTRAKHQAVVWWVPTKESRDSSLCRLLFLRDDSGRVREAATTTPDDDAAAARFEELAARAPGSISVERVDGGDGTVWDGPEVEPVPLGASTFSRALDPRWRRTSYSGITAGAHEARVGSEAEEPTVTDEAPLVGSIPPGSGPARPRDPAGGGALAAVASRLASMRGGAEVGTFVHGVLEASDFTAPDLAAELSAAVAAQQARRLVEIGATSEVVAGLEGVLETPLGPAVGDLRLRDLARGDRLDELVFELPLVGGDTPTATVAIAEVARLLREHLEPGDPLAGYAERLPSLQDSLRGYLTGSLDLVLRTPDGRYAVVDYKTNWLGVAGEELTVWHYRPAALWEAMVAAHYPLQALLYTVALHRYLRWRLPTYHPERHLAGVLYLFVRGMVGGATPVVDGQPCGVFAWQPPPALVESLSDLFDTGTVPG
jgi:exodeoxyribonuclease V beta subunit